MNELTNSAYPVFGSRLRKRPVVGFGWLTAMAFRFPAIFPVPGIQTLIARGWDPEKAPLRIAPTPREANLLLVCGPLPPPLIRATAVAFAQMPRPRLVAFNGFAGAPYLPPPDLVIDDFENGDWLQEVADRMRARPDSHACRPYEPDFLRDAFKEDESEEDGGEHEHHHHDHDDHHEEEQEDDEGGDHDDHGGGGHDHDSMGFMSMVMLTKDTPRSDDGLAMDRNTARFGPFLAGLGDGVSLRFELDGDSVVEGAWTGGEIQQDLLDRLPSREAYQLADYLEKCQLATPRTGRLLAHAVLLQAAGKAPDELWWLQCLCALEGERLRSHAGWLLTFGETIGLSWLRDRTRTLLSQLRGEADLPRLTARLRRKLRKTPYLKPRLAGLGSIDDASLSRMEGPIARASGSREDARSDNIAYQSVGFQPLSQDSNDAWGRLVQRLEEMEQSARLIEAARIALPKKQDHRASLPLPDISNATGIGLATLESPRGPMRLRVELQNGTITAAKLQTPSPPVIAAIPSLVAGQELADALIAVASLDISPFEGPLNEKEDGEGDEDERDG